MIIDWGMKDAYQLSSSHGWIWVSGAVVVVEVVRRGRIDDFMPSRDVIRFIDSDRYFRVKD